MGVLSLCQIQIAFGKGCDRPTMSKSFSQYSLYPSSRRGTWIFRFTVFGRPGAARQHGFGDVDQLASALELVGENVGEADFEFLEEGCFT